MMKQLLILLSMLFCTMGYADDITINWVDGDTNYANTTCTIGGDLIIPNTTPTKYGYTFNGWELLEPYTELEYIESTGTQYIDTGIIGTNDTRIDVDFQLTETAYTILFGTGAADSSTPGSESNYFFANQPNWEFGFYIDGSFNYVGLKTNLYRHTVSYNNAHKYYFDENEITTYQTTPSWMGINIWLFASHDDGSGTAVRPIKTKLYSAKLWQNNTLVFDGVPARRNSDSVLGLYDTVSRTFFTNGGIGTFIAGPEKE